MGAPQSFVGVQMLFQWPKTHINLKPGQPETAGCPKWPEMSLCRHFSGNGFLSNLVPHFGVTLQFIIKRKTSLIYHKSSLSLIPGALPFSVHWWGLSSGRWFVPGLCLAVPGKREKMSPNKVTNGKNKSQKGPQFHPLTCCYPTSPLAEQMGQTGPISSTSNLLKIVELPARGEFGLISFLSMKEMESLGVWIFVFVVGFSLVFFFSLVWFSFRVWGLLFLRENENIGSAHDIFVAWSHDSRLSVVPSTDSLLQSILKSPKLLPLLMGSFMCRIKAVGISFLEGIAKKTTPQNATWHRNPWLGTDHVSPAVLSSQLSIAGFLCKQTSEKSFFCLSISNIFGVSSAFRSIATEISMNYIIFVVCVRILDMPPSFNSYTGETLSFGSLCF